MIRSILEEIWYGNIVPIESITPPAAEEAELVDLIDRNRSKLLDRLTEEEKAMFEKYEDVAQELYSLNAKQAFEYGFKLGTRIVIESIA